VIEADDKRRARLNMIHHLLDSIPYFAATRPPLDLPKRPGPPGYERPPRALNHYVPDYAAEVIAAHEKHPKPGGKGAAKPDKGSDESS
jgi:hypothetical protein